MTNNYIVFNQEKTVGYLHSVKNVKNFKDNEKLQVHTLHCHDDYYEIIMLINGDLEFHVEGSIYKPVKHDIIIVRPNELHKLIAYSSKPYERYTLHISSTFFKKHNCQRFEDIFNNRKLGSNNLIPSSFVNKWLLNLFIKIEEYFQKKEYFVLDAILIHFLYELNAFNGEPQQPITKNERIKDIILFINDNLNKPITLELLSEKFFIDKYHLCKIFKKNTSFTVHQYITYKRVLLARDYKNKGLPLMESATKAGFNNYSNFYKAHIKFMGTTPKDLP